VKFGVGRYLYRLPATWYDYDPQAKRLLNVPALPAVAARPASNNTISVVRPTPARPAVA